MTQYLISFGAHAMDHVPDEDAPAVARAARAAVQEAINAGVYVSAGGLDCGERGGWGGSGHQAPPGRAGTGRLGQFRPQRLNGNPP